MQTETLNIVILVFVFLCVCWISINGYRKQRQEELSSQYTKIFGKKVDVDISLYRTEQHLFKKYILRKESFLHYTERMIKKESQDR